MRPATRNTGNIVNKELRKAITIAGSQEALAEAISARLLKKITRQTISYWLRSHNGVPKPKATVIKELYPQLSLVALMLIREEVANGRQ